MKKEKVSRRTFLKVSTATGAVASVGLETVPLTRTADASKVEMLDIVCNPSSTIPIPHRLAILTSPKAAGVRLKTSAGGKTIDDAVVAKFADKPDRVVVAVPDVDAPGPASITLSSGETLEATTGPVKTFDILLMPTSHLCFGYNSGLPEHIEAGRVVVGAVDIVETNPNYRWNIEFTRGAVNLVDKYPRQAALARQQYQEGRLGIGGFWAPATFEDFDGEAEIRQLVEAQWWLRQNFGSISHVALGCDSGGFDPQQPQVFRQAGIEFYWRCRYTLNEKESGSPFIEHVGVDGTRLPCFVSRPPLGSGYIWSPIGELRMGGPLPDRSHPKFGGTVEAIADHVRNTKEISGATLNFNFTGTDQSHVDRNETRRIAAWNKIFRTPRVTFASIGAAADRLLKTPEFRRDEQEGEQPTWAPVSVAACRLTLPFQRASYALATAEKAAAIDLVVNGAPYPEVELQAAWLSVISEQHHEQLGDGAHDQVENSRDLIVRATDLARDITECAARRVASKIDFRRPEQPVTVFNFLNWSRRDIVEAAPLGENLVVRDSAGNVVPHDLTENGKLRFVAEVAGLGYSTYYVEESAVPSAPAGDLKGAANRIENAFYRLEVDANTGCVLSLFDKELQATITKSGSDRLPFELVVNEDNGEGYCTFWPTGRMWRAADFGGAKVKVKLTGLSARLVVERPLLADQGEARVGNHLRIEYELPTQTKRLDVSVTVDWDSEPKRELRLFVPFALSSPRISYDTLFATRDYDPDLPKRQHLYEINLTGYGTPKYDPKAHKKRFFEHRNVTRFVSAYDEARDIGTTLSAPHGLLRVEHGGVSFTLVEDRTDVYVHMFPAMKGRHVFCTSLTSHRGDWKTNKAWRFGWEHRGRFNNLVAVLPERLYPVLPENAKLLEIDGESLVLTALKKSHVGEDLVARVYDAAGQDCQFGFRLKTPYVGHKPYEIGRARHGQSVKGVGLVCSQRPLSPLDMLGASETNLLEDPQRPIDLGEVGGGRVPVRPHGILTARFAFEVLDHALVLKEQTESQTGDKVLDERQ